MVVDRDQSGGFQHEHMHHYPDWRDKNCCLLTNVNDVLSATEQLQFEMKNYQLLMETSCWLYLIDLGTLLLALLYYQLLGSDFLTLSHSSGPKVVQTQTPCYLGL
jgi:hypothetical protein